MLNQVMSSTLSHVSDESGVESLSDTVSNMSLTTVKPRESFKIINKIGEGFFADVFLVREKPDDKAMVLKQTKCGKPSEQLTNEITILSSLNHPNVLALMVEIEDRQDCAIFELCDGGDLAQYVDNHGPLSLAHTKRWSREITDGVNYLHQNNILHRDLKADNILLAGDSLRIGDFGGAVVMKKGQMMTALEGSPINCAPEMIKGEGYSFPRDWWSVGIMIYQMIVGELPFMAHDQMGIFVKILMEDVEYPDFVDFATREIIEGLLQKEPSIRSKACDLYDQEWFLNINNQSKLAGHRSSVDSGFGDDDDDFDFE